MSRDSTLAGRTGWFLLLSGFGWLISKVSRAALDRGDTEYPCSYERLFPAAPCLPARKMNGTLPG